MIRSTCERCGQPIEFRRTKNTLTGRSIDCDPTPSAIFGGAGFEQIVTASGDLVTGTSAPVDAGAPVVEGWRPHWQSCTAFAEHRATMTGGEL